jgi:hypothetical protein
MTTHPEERRIAGLLRELVTRSGRQANQLEDALGWERGGLARLLEEPNRGRLGEVLALIAELQISPAEFFDQLRERPGVGQEPYGGSAAEGLEAARFTESRRVIEEAIARRKAWKIEKDAG